MIPLFIMAYSKYLDYAMYLSTSDIYESFEKFDETHALVQNISKAFDKSWQNVIYKL